MWGEMTRYMEGVKQELRTTPFIQTLMRCNDHKHAETQPNRRKHVPSSATGQDQKSSRHEICSNNDNVCWTPRLLKILSAAATFMRQFLTEHHAMKAYGGSGGIAQRILDLGTRWEWVVNFTHRQHYPQGKRPWYPLNRSLGEPHGRSGCGGEEKNSQHLPGLETHVVQVTDYWLLINKGLVIGNNNSTSKLHSGRN
jgi:hypothetical protein